jgi:hypothetical protein
MEGYKNLLSIQPGMQQSELLQIFGDKCSVADLIKPQPDLLILIPELLISVIKFFYDVTLFFAGAFYFWKFRSIKKQIEKDIKERRVKKGLGGPHTVRMSLNILSSKIIEMFVWCAFLLFAVRIFLKDVFFAILEFDKMYIASCRCSEAIENIYIT